MLYILIFIPLIISFTISYLFTNNESFQKNNENKPFWQPPGYMFSIIWSILYLLNGYVLYLVICNKKYFTKINFYFIISLFILQLALENYWVIYTSKIDESDFKQLLILFILVFVILLRILHFSKLLLPLNSLLLCPEIMWLCIAISLQAYNIKKCII